MENASKALIMAGGILIALLIIALLVYAFSNMANYQSEQDKQLDEQTVNKFNNEFTTFNRENVRGTDLYSLLNKAIDYNKRQTTASTSGIAYLPITVTLDFKDKKNLLQKDSAVPLQIFSPTSKRTYTASETNNELEEIMGKGTNSKVGTLESVYGGDTLTKLVTGMEKIFLGPANSVSESDKKTAFEEFEKIVPDTISNRVGEYKGLYIVGKVRPGTTVYKDVCAYYEFIYFKRGIFDCTNCKYDQATGRVVQMDFVFTGKFN